MPKYGQSSAHFDLNLDRSNFGLPPLSLPNWFDCDLEVLWVELKQILHLKVGCSDFGPVKDRGSLPYLLHLEVDFGISALFGTGAVYPTCCVNLNKACFGRAHSPVNIHQAC